MTDYDIFWHFWVKRSQTKRRIAAERNMTTAYLIDKTLTIPGKDGDDVTLKSSIAAIISFICEILI